MLWAQIHYNLLIIVEDTNSIQFSYPVGEYPGNFVQKLKRTYAYIRYISVVGNASLNRDYTDISSTIARKVCFYLNSFIRMTTDAPLCTTNCITNDDKIVTYNSICR